MNRSTRARSLRLEAFEDRIIPHGGLAAAGGFEYVTDFTYLTPPSLSSLPGAAAKLYLDFNGNFEANWFIDSVTDPTPFTDIATPSFDTDGNPNTFTGTEMGLMTDIWKRVAEDFAPFKIDVTTIDPGDFSDKKGLHVVIGGSNSDWLGLDTSGISSIGSFSGPAPNVVFVFSQDIIDWSDAGLPDADGTPIQIAPAVATTASHESGHSFGLLHQSLWAGGSLVSAYNPGGADRTPIMGANLDSDRTTWYYGTSITGMLQSDMPTIASSANGFGYRLDSDNTFGTATNLAWSGGKLNGSGVVATTTDKDYYKFDTTGGIFNFTAAVADTGPNLDARLELWTHKLKPTPADPFGFVDTLVASADPSPDLNATFMSNLTAGTYYLVVQSHGTYGDVGQYTLQVEPFFVVGKPLSVGGMLPTTGAEPAGRVGLPTSPFWTGDVAPTNRPEPSAAPRASNRGPAHDRPTTDVLLPRGEFVAPAWLGAESHRAISFWQDVLSDGGLFQSAGSTPALYPH